MRDVREARDEKREGEVDWARQSRLPLYPYTAKVLRIRSSLYVTTAVPSDDKSACLKQLLSCLCAIVAAP
jgi:hypothetical protein